MATRLGQLARRLPLPVLQRTVGTEREQELDHRESPAFGRPHEETATSLGCVDLRGVARQLAEEPELIHWRSTRSHRGTLLHDIGANGIEEKRLKTPPNAVELLQLLLDHGAEADALCATYSGGPAQTTLALLYSSSWPAEAGLQRSLVRRLASAPRASRMRTMSVRRSATNQPGR